MIIFREQKLLREKRRLRRNLKHSIFLIFLACLLTHIFSSQSFASIEAGRCYSSWNDLTDATLRGIVEKFTEEKKPWIKIAEEFNATLRERFSQNQIIEEKTGKACRERYFDHLRPHINKQALSEVECKKVLELVSQYGTKWVKIEKEIGSGRTAAHIKNTYYAKLMKYHKNGRKKNLAPRIRRISRVKNLADNRTCLSPELTAAQTLLLLRHDYHIASRIYLASYLKE